MSKSKSWHSIPEYQALRAVMQSGTTTGAAAQLGLSQSAISRSIANLEGRIGKMLFERDGGRLRPTQEAVRLNFRLDPLFDALNRIEGPDEPVQETMRLIAPPTYSHRFLVSQVAGFLKANPHFFVSLEVNTSDGVIRGILEDRFDLGLIGVDLSRAGLKLAPFRRSLAVCVLPKMHALASRAQIEPKDFEGQNLIALSHRHARRAQLDRMFQETRTRPNIVAEVTTSFAAADLVKEGLGIAVINPFPLYQYRSEEIVFVPFVSPIRYTTYFLTSDQRPVPRIARAFMRHMRLHTHPDPFTEKV
ncbi:LysR family transcriptional regulator [Litoreibacter roseus]|uniref:LysR family transcriptional regulator n=1 Tax=Litoreibacter roseus TaxID=2601869 RepID=A0A6N6JIR1_9RHOB|nr:LysR family transcriptional regulator [Litoreibacter roseus]GFE66004.1 LysR family transcriptional regulator [Litoreibacter roseus]